MSASSSSASQIAPKASFRQQNNQHNSNQQQVPMASQQQAHMSSPSLAFQQVKQTQASLARLSRVQQQQQQQQQISQTNQSSQHQANKQDHQPSITTKSTTFVDCLIRRFKDCFSEDFCTVPMFVVGNLSPGSDGTHLILPPCVSLGRQSINRFAGPKNQRLMNSIRESCRSIEELDLGGNKLTDLIEVYKILQCTPNLRFLNLSENDLSRTSPVATSSLSSAAAATSSGSLAWQWPAGSSMASLQTQVSHHQHQQRTCLAPINQNRPSGVGAHRRHSTLGQSMAGSQVSRGAPTRLTEARRLAAAAALAQSKKTSPALAASKMAAVASGQSVSGDGQSSGGNQRQADEPSAGRQQLRHQTTPASTMHLARSLSSLSAKDAVRKSASSHSLTGRLAAAHRKEVATAAGKFGGRNINSTPQTAGPSGSRQNPAGSKVQPNSNTINSNASRSIAAGKQTLQLAAVETIAESSEMLDVDMGNIHNAGSDAQPTGSSLMPASISQPVPISSNQHQVRSSPQQSSSISSPLTRSSLNFSAASSSSSQSPNFRRTFESIKALALNNTGCQWRVVCSILSRMPNLEELHLSLNNYERIDLDPNEFRHPALRRLYLCNNPKLTNWEELDKLLVAFPSLQALSIADCNISQIPENLDRAREWRKLCGLNINGWPIKEWPVIERLNQLPSLIDLKCRNLEILNTIDEPRHHLIARLPKLQRLNGSEIEEREDAEKAFLRFFMANSHLERPTRFHELVQIHGEVAPVDVDVDLSPPSQAQVRVIYLNRNYYKKENEDDILMSEDFLIKLMDEQPQADQQQESLMEMTDNDNADNSGDNASAGKLIRLFKDEGQEVLAIEVDLRQSVRKFKSSLATFFGLDNPNNLILYYIDREMVGLMGPELIKHNQKKLWNYNVQDGDQFIVEER